jgi:hypothetical protein
MGGAVGLLQNDSRIPKDTLDKVIINRDVKRQIAQKDAKLLKKLLREPWKPHKEIIKLLTERTKHQLELITYIFSRANRVGGYHTDIAEELIKLGGVYGEFLRLLVTRDFVIDSELIDSALSGIGCDEEVLAEVLCTISEKDLLALMQYYAKWKGDSLLWKISRKLVPNSPFTKFITLLLQNPSRQSTPASSSETLHQYADQLLQNGLGSFDANESQRRNDDVIFPILISLRREQCQELSDILLTKCQQSLVELIQQKYKGSIAYSLLFWIDSSLISSQAKRLYHILTSSSSLNKLHLNSFLSKYDRNTLIDILNQCDELYPSTNLENLIYSLTTGHHREAIEGWINNHTCDGDHENAIKEMFLEYEVNSEVIQNESWFQKLSQHLDGENAVLAKYISVHKVDLPRSLSVEARVKPLPPGSKRAEFLSQQSMGNISSDHDQSHVWNPASGGHPPIRSNTSSPRHSEEEIEWNRKCKLVLELLAERFALEDQDNSGTLGRAPSLSAPLFVSVSLPHSLCLCLPLCLSLSLSLPLCLSLSPSLSPSLSLL